jgi:hypothetical protein
MIALLFSPIGRYLAIGALALAILAGVYFKIRSDAELELEAQAAADQIRRMNDAIRAGDSIDVRPDRLREPDKNLRD